MYIREVLGIKESSQIVSIAPDADIAEAVRQLAAHDIGSLVVTQGDRMVGFITERRIVRALQARGCVLEGVKVSDLMEKEPIVASSEDTVDYARDVLTKHRINHLVIMDQDKLTGVISYHDVARASLKEVNFQNSLLKRYIKNWPE